MVSLCSKNLELPIIIEKSKFRHFKWRMYLMLMSSTKLEIRAEQVLPGSKGRWEREGGGRGHGGEMTQTMYAHVNK
jgi:hypothetical protein